MRQAAWQQQPHKIASAHTFHSEQSLLLFSVVKLCACNLAQIIAKINNNRCIIHDDFVTFHSARTHDPENITKHHIVAFSSPFCTNGIYTLRIRTIFIGNIVGFAIDNRLADVLMIGVRLDEHTVAGDFDCCHHFLMHELWTLLCTKLRVNCVCVIYFLSVLWRWLCDQTQL